MDYYVFYEEGDLDNDHAAVRVRVKKEGPKSGIEIIDKVEVGFKQVEKIVKGKKTQMREPVYASVQSGFGVNREQALFDFIRRNESVVLDKIFDLRNN